MLLIIEKKATKNEIEVIAEEFDGYIKIVVDVKRKILAGGEERHFDLEQRLLDHGSEQEDLWGGGIDKETKEIDYNSVINLRPTQDNPSREILSTEIRKKFDTIVNDLLSEIYG